MDMTVIERCSHRVYHEEANNCRRVRHSQAQPLFGAFYSQAAKKRLRAPKRMKTKSAH